MALCRRSRHAGKAVDRRPEHPFSTRSPDRRSRCSRCATRCRGFGGVRAALLAILAAGRKVAVLGFPASDRRTMAVLGFRFGFVEKDGCPQLPRPPGGTHQARGDRSMSVLVDARRCGGRIGPASILRAHHLEPDAGHAFQRQGPCTEGLGLAQRCVRVHAEVLYGICGVHLARSPAAGAMQ